MSNVADVKSLRQPGVHAANATFAQISVLRRYNLRTFKARYRKPRFGDGTKFADDYVKLARGSLRLHFCGSEERVLNSKASIIQIS
jgi:hypothetical protein